MAQYAQHAAFVQPVTVLPSWLLAFRSLDLPSANRKPSAEVLRLRGGLPSLTSNRASPLRSA
jgi:hypothetical protein